MLKDFNIKTFPAETAVFRDGVFCPELSTLISTDITRTYKKPVHIIYVGELAGENELDIRNFAENQKIILTVKIKNKMPAFLNILIKNTGKNSEILGNVAINNTDNFKYRCFAEHLCENTGIFVKTKVLGERNSFSELTGTAFIPKNCAGVNSDISFSAMLCDGARIKFSPSQKISSVPNAADHSASIYHATQSQIQYLRGAGLSGVEVDTAIREAFMNDF